ncbi:MAG TPA: hypothetical protein VIJ48_01545 [Acidimicrobiia bacterium]|jgi:hypothetical protein
MHQANTRSQRLLVSGTEIVDFLLDRRGVIDIEMQFERLQLQER